MNESEIKDFRSFIHSQRKLDKRKDLELFDLITSEPEPKDLEASLYDQENKEAYHAVRKRLLKKLSNYIVLKRIEEDTTASSSVMGFISLAKYLFERGMDQLAWSYLKNAEEIASENEQYDLLNNIYLLQIENVHSDYADDVNDIISKKVGAKVLADEDERATIACSLIKKELKCVMLEGKDVDFEGVIKLVLTSYNLTNAVISRPKILYNILSISRSAILANKDYYNFEPYLIDQYKKAKEQFGFSRNSHFYKLSILYMIAHVLYRNRKFEPAAEYLNEMKSDLFAYNESQLMLFYSKYILLSAGVKIYQGKLNESIEILESELAKNSKYFSTKDLIKLQINLAIYYFLKCDYKNALTINNKLEHSDKWFEKNLGKEWVFKKGIMEIIAQIEMNNLDIALNRIRSVERSYQHFFSKPLYHRTKAYLNLIKKYIQNPINFNEHEVGELIEKTLTTIPEEQEDLQAMTFYSWLKSKLLKRDYYEVLLETVKSEF